MARKKPVQKANQKKYILNLILILFILVIVFFLIVILSNQKQNEAAKTFPKSVLVKTLSELQMQACNIADQAGTCSSRLAEVGIVLKEDCCEVLGKCC